MSIEEIRQDVRWSKMDFDIDYLCDVDPWSASPILMRFIENVRWLRTEVLALEGRDNDAGIETPIYHTCMECGTLLNGPWEEDEEVCPECGCDVGKSQLLTLIPLDTLDKYTVV